MALAIANPATTHVAATAMIAPTIAHALANFAKVVVVFAAPFTAVAVVAAVVAAVLAVVATVVTARNSFTACTSATIPNTRLTPPKVLLIMSVSSSDVNDPLSCAIEIASEAIATAIPNPAIAVELFAPNEFSASTLNSATVFMISASLDTLFDA